MAKYLTIVEADIYFSERLDSLSWEGASDTEKNKALTTATRDIDRLNFNGTKTESDQELQFPRGGDVVVPADIQHATCEHAYALLDGKEPELEFENLKMGTHNYGNIKSTYDTKAVMEHIQSGIMSRKAWNYLLPYLRDPLELPLSRG